jgi:hypothetical protein
MNSNEFEGHYETINGKKVLVLKPKIKEIIRDNGKRDVVIEVPSLSIINQVNL